MPPGFSDRVLERVVGLASKTVPPASAPPAAPASIFVLRNNDLGDLLVVTPLFEALKRRFPKTHLGVGIGPWNADILAGNPYIDEVLFVSAPWYNKFAHGTKPWAIARYLATSPEVEQVRQRQFEVGIDVLGSAWGSLLLLRAEIPYRLGVNGYAGGHTGVQQAVTYNPFEQVGRSALRFAECLGATELPPARPQLFLTETELSAGRDRWRSTTKRVAIGPGGSVRHKCWPVEHYRALVQLLFAARDDLEIAVVGGPGDRDLGAAIASGHPAVTDLTGQLPLRATFAFVAAADFVITNTSMLMHAAAAFSKATVVLLGESFYSARQHDAQWGYPGTCVTLGKDPDGRQSIYAPDEACAEILTRLPA